MHKNTSCLNKRVLNRYFFAQKAKNVQKYLAISNNNRNFADVFAFNGMHIESMKRNVWLTKLNLRIAQT